jgi:two-component system, NtrC family, nitrogen regulation sensor histidine kinase GlnL
MMPATGAIWAALPVPALLIAPDNGVERILGCNPAAELFLSTSSAALSGEPALDRLTIDAPMEEALARSRLNRAPIFINDVDVCTGDRPPVLCNLQIAPLADGENTLLLLIAPRDIAGRLGRTQAVKSAGGRPSAWPRCWRTRSRTRLPVSPGPRSCCPWGCPPPTANSPT